MNQINKKFLKNGKLQLDREDVEFFLRALEAWDFALLHQKGLAESTQDVKDYICKRSEEIRTVKRKYFHDPNEIVMTAGSRGFASKNY